MMPILAFVNPAEAAPVWIWIILDDVYVEFCRVTYRAMLKDRDYDVTPHIILILSLTLTQNERRVGERLRGVVWIWSAKSARCTVKMVGEVARG